MQTDPAPPLFTIVCVSNNADILARFLLPSVGSQRAPHELRVIDNNREKHPSAAAALNAGARDARGRYLMFVHHDVAWDEPDFLETTAAQLDRLPRLGVAGPVGMTERGANQTERGRGSVLEGPLPGRPGAFPRVTAPEAVQTLDELMLIVPAEVFRRLPFDEGTCDGWHLYGTDYCLSVRQLGLEAYVLPLVVHHLSGGTVNAGYFRTLRKVVAKHRPAFARIYTTCDPWSTSGPDWLNPLNYYRRYYTRCVKGALLRTLIRLGLRKPKRAA